MDESNITIALINAFRDRLLYLVEKAETRQELLEIRALSRRIFRDFNRLIFQ